MRIEEMTLTPALANEWLLTVNQEQQRKFRDHHATKLSEAIKRGEWRRNNDMIMHGPHGLGNGQHRCAAVVKSGKSIPVVVAFECTEEEIKRADQGGLPRRNEDALHYAGISNSTNISAVVNTIFRDFERNRFAPSSVEAVNFVKANYDSLTESLRFWKKGTGRHSPVEPSLICALHYLAKQNNRTSADAFCEAVSDGVSRERGDAVWMLLRRMTDAKSGVAKIDRRTKAAFIIKAFVAFHEGRKLPFLRWCPGQKEEFPVIP